MAGSAPKRLRNIALAGRFPTAPDRAMRDHAPVPGLLRHYGLLVLPLVACVLLVVAEFSRLYEINVITVTVSSVKGGGHHGYALLVVALASAAMAFGAVV